MFSNSSLLPQGKSLLLSSIWQALRPSPNVSPCLGHVMRLALGLSESIIAHDTQHDYTYKAISMASLSARGLSKSNASGHQQAVSAPAPGLPYSPVYNLPLSATLMSTDLKEYIEYIDQTIQETVSALKSAHDESPHNRSSR